MQTFLPYPSFIKSAECLDNKRLGKQRVEVYQILRTLAGESKGWANHPAVLMWKGYERYLGYYGMFCCGEWTERGFRDTLETEICELSHLFEGTGMAPWFGNWEFHASHRSNLLRKDPAWYGAFGWTEPDNLPYYWPSKHNN